MTKTFAQLFVAARSVSTPIIAIRTADAASTVVAIRAVLGTDADKAPLAQWDAVTGLRGLNDAGGKEVASMLTQASVEDSGATVAFSLTLGVLKCAKAQESDLIVFVHNYQLQDRDAQNIQGVINLRDPYKGSGSLLVLLIGAGDVLPTELQQDVLVLEHPLPTREELVSIVKQVEKDAKVELGAEVIKQATDALIGLPAFPSEQATAMCLDRDHKVLDIDSLWARKRSIVSQMPGLSFHTGEETLDDAYGVESVKKFGMRLMTGKRSPSLILRMDEIEKQFAGTNSLDGTKGDMLGEFLTWVNDRQIICSLFLGVPGSSKSWITYCLAGEYKKPCIDYSISAMQDSLVGNSGKNQRNAQRTIEAISDGRVWLIATANSLTNLPPELISRFQVGGIWFFDAPEQKEREGILKLKVAKYGLDAKQPMPEMTGWTGREIENCARKADLLGVSLEEAGKYVVPLLKSHAEQMRDLRQSAHDRFLSASHEGVYRFTEDVLVETAAAGRRMR
jgi:hypothetical protein